MADEQETTSRRTVEILTAFQDFVRTVTRVTLSLIEALEEIETGDPANAAARARSAIDSTLSDVLRLQDGLSRLRASDAETIPAPPPPETEAP